MRNKASSSSSKSNSSKKPTTKRPAQKQQAPSGASRPEQQKESQEDRARQQALLDVFRTAFYDILNSPDFTAQLQEVKTALYNRDFEAAFACESALAVYAARWSPTRALCYGHILRGLDGHIQALIESESSSEKKGADDKGDNDEDEIPDTPAPAETQDDGEVTTASEPQDPQPETNQKALRVLAIGGAAAELVAIADYLTSGPSPIPRPEITLLDIAPWTPVIEALTKVLTTAGSKPAYYTQAGSPTLLLPALNPTISQADILSTDVAALISGEHPVLITLLFTLNELYTASGTKATTAFLQSLTTHAPAGSLLLVVDSPGSYAETAVGKDGRRYPMQWLLHHTLVPPPPATRGGEEKEKEKGKKRWERVESHDSIWFRVAEDLRYPIALENMRYQLHLYRVCVD